MTAACSSLIPWHDHVLVGTTDTPVTELPVEPRPLHQEVAYLLTHLARYLERAPGRGEIKSIYAGLRPLLRGRERSSTAKLSREHAVVVSPSGLVTITGGKWTTYRRMAIDAVDQAAHAGSLQIRPSFTAELKLHGHHEGADGDESFLTVYGSDATDLAALCQERPEWNQPLHPALPYRSGEVIWAARHEAARCVTDVLARRTARPVPRRPRQHRRCSPGRCAPGPRAGPRT